VICHTSATGAPCSSFTNSRKFQSNSIKFHLNSTPRTFPDFLNSILSRILKSYNKESCSLFQHIHTQILFENFQARESHLWIDSIRIRLNFCLNKSQARLIILGRPMTATPTGPPHIHACAAEPHGMSLPPGTAAPRPVPAARPPPQRVAWLPAIPAQPDPPSPPIFFSASY
jgi:hypothetical protein